MIWNHNGRQHGDMQRKDLSWTPQLFRLLPRWAVLLSAA